MQKIRNCGLKIGVVTGSGQRTLIERLLNDFSDFLTEDQVTTAFDVKRGKPNPDPYLTGLRKAGNYAPYEAYRGRKRTSGHPFRSGRTLFYSGYQQRAIVRLLSVGRRRQHSIPNHPQVR